MTFKNIIFFLLPIFLICACSNDKGNKQNDKTLCDSLATNLDTIPGLTTEKNRFDSMACGLNFNPELSYSTTKKEINQLKQELYNKYISLTDSSSQNIFLDSAGYIFTNNLLNEVIPYWYGTPWDFEGYTSEPNEGKIACGYFVSTTLRDMGINVNRYKLAQQAPENEARSIAINSENMLLMEFMNPDNNVISELDKLEKGLYFIGLDNHVGYLYIKNKEKYFIHSNYILGKVMVEIAKYSEAFKSTRYYISKISHNRSLILTWLKNDELTIISE